MKRSIEKRFTVRVSILLLFSYIILFFGSLVLASYVSNEQNKKYSKAILSIYCDLVIYQATEENVPIGNDIVEEAITYGDYISTWLTVDYVYIYKPDIQNNTITYLCAAQKEGASDNKIENHLIGKTREYTLSEDELAVWNGEELFGQVKTKNIYGHEIETVMLIKDSYGNKYLAGVSIPFAVLQNQVFKMFSTSFLLITLVIICINLFVYLLLHKQVSSPAKRISLAMNNYAVGEHKSSEKLEENGSAEYMMIAEAFNKMTDDIDKYLENIKKLTTEKAQQKAEIDIASRIQTGFLADKSFETFKYRVDAVMNPAKDVGGDLYYYHSIDSSHVLVFIADVSGKGISAAMFMSVVLAMVNQLALLNLSPEEILRNINSSLTHNNPALLFATAFVGIYDTEQNIFTYSNAGHNRPYVLGKTVKILKSEVGTPLGLFEKEKYPQSSVKIEPGDIIFLYTDGVSEAVNKSREFYTVQRLEQTLQSFIESGSKDVIDYIGKSVKDFSDGAEQYDDITMLSLTVKETNEMTLDFDIHNFEKIKERILASPLPYEKKLNFCLAAEECFANICSYAFEDGVPDGEKVKITVTSADCISVTFEDGGQPFNQLENVSAADDFDIDSQTGGLGRYIIMSNVDDASYKYINGKNILTLTAYYKEEEK